mmetsp:Transcript_6312/g.19922  ORF Transcript_6312/g.19922 Transcript_6312/m.19922 type:complete len:242 (+) Transcript_6312:78-803(+)
MPRGRAAPAAGAPRRTARGCSGTSSRRRGGAVLRRGWLAVQPCGRRVRVAAACVARMLWFLRCGGPPGMRAPAPPMRMQLRGSSQTRSSRPTRPSCSAGPAAGGRPPGRACAVGSACRRWWGSTARSRSSRPPQRRDQSPVRHGTRTARRSGPCSRPPPPARGRGAVGAHHRLWGPWPPTSCSCLRSCWRGCSPSRTPGRRRSSPRRSCPERSRARGQRSGRRTPSAASTSSHKAPACTAT